MDFNKLNYYQILGISANATQEDVKKAYRQQAKKYHPDRHFQDTREYIDATEKMAKINEAYETLSDLEKRRQYDKTIIKSENQTAYNSYTKTRDESESDLEDWLKEYLKRGRRLDHLYNLYKEVEGKIINLRGGYLTPNPLDIQKSKILLEEIRKTLLTPLSFEPNNPIKILENLFSELEEPVNNINAQKKGYLRPDPRDEIMANLLFGEIGLFFKKYTDKENEYYSEVMRYIFLKYVKTAETNARYRRLHMAPTPVKEVIENILLQVLQANKDYISNFPGNNPSKKHT